MEFLDKETLLIFGSLFVFCSELLFWHPGSVWHLRSLALLRMAIFRQVNKEDKRI